jgi:hypothetical protein
MTALRQIQVRKWTGTVLAVVLLSATIARWNAFKAAPTPGAYAGLLFSLTAFLLLMAALAVAVYAEEKARGRLNRPRPLLDRLSERLFPASTNEEHDKR